MVRAKQGHKRGAGGGRSSRPAGRRGSVQLKTAKGRKVSSVRWLSRQLSDDYVAEAARRGWRSRAAWKLAQLDDQFRFLAPAKRVVDLGAAPGGWTQVVVERVRPGPGGGRVVAVDTVAMEPVPGAELLELDLREAADCDRLVAALDGAVDVVLSDMAAPATGHRATDRLRAAALGEAAHDLARQLLGAGGTLVLKAFHGGGEAALMAALKRDFRRVRTVKPPASRAESAEIYIVASFYRGGSEAASKTATET